MKQDWGFTCEERSIRGALRETGRNVENPNILHLIGKHLGKKNVGFLRTNYSGWGIVEVLDRLFLACCNEEG